MANLFSSSLKSQPSSLCCFHCLLISCRNVSPKSSQRLQFCNAIPCFAKRSVTHHAHMISKSNDPSGSSSNSVSEDFDIVSTTECSDGSIVYHFGNISEIMENIVDVDQEKIPQTSPEEEGKISTEALLSEDVEKSNLEGDSDESHAHRSGSNNTEVGHNLSGEIDSLSVMDLGNNLITLSDDDDKESQPPANESKVDISLENSMHLEFDLVEQGKHENHHEDAVSEVQDFPSVAEENSEVNNQTEVVVPTVSPESGVYPDLVEEKKHETDHEDVVSEVQDVLSASGEKSEVDGHTGVVVPTISSESGVSSDLIEEEKHEADNEDVVCDVPDVPSASGEISEVNGQTGVVVPTVTPESSMPPDLVEKEKHETDNEDVVLTVTLESIVSPDLAEKEKHADVSKVKDISTVSEENSEVNRQVGAVPIITPESGVSADLVEIEKQESDHEDVVSDAQHVSVVSKENSEVNIQAGAVVSTVTSDSGVTSDIVEEKKHENCDDDDVASEAQDIQIVSGERSGIDSHMGVVVPTVTPESGVSPALVKEEKQESYHEDLISEVQDMSGVSEENSEVTGHTGVVISTGTSDSCMSPDLVEAEKQENYHEDVSTDQDVQIVSGESSKVMVPTVTPESNVSPDFNINAPGSVEEKKNEGRRLTLKLLNSLQLMRIML